MQANSVISHSPSFSSYTSSDKLAKIAARVVQEFKSQSDFDDYLLDETSVGENVDKVKDNEEEGEEEEEFEFAFVSAEPDLCPIPADEIFYNGQIRPVYPLFNTNLLFGDEPTNSSPVRVPLGKLFREERNYSASCSSSEADELDGVPAGMYCVWRPKTEESPGRCKKSNSTGSSKRWKFRQLLHRSNSDGGKGTFVFLTPSNKKRREGKGVNETAKSTGKVEPVAEGALPPRYERKGAVIKESDRRRSYLPDKKDLVGLLASVNGVSRNLHPF